MNQNDSRLEKLLERLDELEKKQNRFLGEIREIRTEIRKITGSEDEPDSFKSREAEPADSDKSQKKGPLSQQLERIKPERKFWRSWSEKFTSGDLETFIGENLISKIGIVVTIIGVAIGARYAIDNDLISPLMRIILGYALGGVLLLAAGKLKKSMIRFSAVLFSGSMAIFYIITFAAFSFYNLLPQGVAFGLMVLITIATVSASIRLDMQPVAHIGLVGAYAVPFLVGGEGSLASFFFYMVIINTGVLATTLYKYWKKLTYTAFLFTWLIVAWWYGGDYTAETDFGITITYVLIFFLIFYMTALSYKLLRVREFERGDVWLILANAFLFYAFGFVMMDGADLNFSWAGLFTAGNALIHSAAAIIVYRAGFADRKLLWLITGLAITFFTLAIPVELDGSWVTLLWSAEAALLFGIGRKSQTAFYERMSHPVLALAFLSLLNVWDNAYSLYAIEAAESGFLPLFNIHFFTSIFFIGCTGWIVWKDREQFGLQAGPYKNPQFNKLIVQLTRLVFIGVLFTAFLQEINGFFNHLYVASKSVSGLEGGAVFISGNEDLLNFRTVWGFTYAMLFAGTAILLLTDRIRKHEFSVLLFIASSVISVLFLLGGLDSLDHLHFSYLNPESNPGYSAGPFHIGIRYISFAFLGYMIAMTGRMCYRTKELSGTNLTQAFDGLAAIVLLWVLSDELMLWMDISEAEQPYRLGLSILWGVYALAAIAIGIWTDKKHLRIGAIVLLGVTLVKLFFYDLADLDAIARTVVFVILGLLLLLASYLYNKYRKSPE